MGLITINEEQCVKCGICIHSCPISIISSNSDKFPVVTPEKEKSCVYCGHCESVCPEEALMHTLSEKALNPVTNELTRIDPSTLGKYFRSRRSIRNYQNKAVDRKILEDIMDIVRYSPTGTNRQMNQWVIVYDARIVKQLATGTIEWMKTVSSANPAMAAGYNFSALVASFERGSDPICRNAPHLIIAYTSAKYSVGAKDATIAASHLELLLPSYGLGGCWAGFLMMAFQYAPELKKIIGLDESHTVHAPLMVGYPKYPYFKVPVRNKPDIKWL
jgi:nitroreductase/NAD-dependent dihydropyrimidine dehydrogenase PreA subunit